MSSRASIHPLTEESIELQGPSLVGMVSQFGCGCELRDGWEATTGKWWLCDYHAGYDDGVAAMADDLVARLRERDSYMNGAENWVLTVHPDDPTRPGTLMVNLPWQAHVPSSDRIIAWLSDTIEGELSDPHGADAFDESLRQPDVVDVIERLRHLIASRVTWRQAAQLVARWTVTPESGRSPEFSRTAIKEE